MEALQRAISRGDLPIALMPAKSGVYYFLLHLILFIWWEYADITLGEIFDELLHGDMLHRSTDDRGHVDNGTMNRMIGIMVIPSADFR